METEKPSLINQIFDPGLIKDLYYHACRVDIEDNNDKALLITELIGPEFVEIGTGTNRAAYLYSPGDDREFRGGAGLIFKFALDRRGFLDSWSSFKRSIEIPMYAPKIYETNMLISVEEYVTLMSKDEFRMNENGIKQILEDLSKSYIFEDIGFNLKNYENYGYRQNGDIVILDIGYMYPIKGNERALSCPKCRAQLKYNSNYTGFVCANDSCKTKYRFIDIRRRMNLALENAEDQMIFNLKHCEVPDFGRLNIV